MKLSRLAMAFAALAFSIGAAQAITVHRSVVVKDSPIWVWLDIGGFCDIEDWHPDQRGVEERKVAPPARRFDGSEGNKGDVELIWLCCPAGFMSVERLADPSVAHAATKPLGRV